MSMFSTIGGRVLSHYEVGKRIGDGGMGEVYSGRDIDLDRPVAIKVLPQWARGDRRARERLIKEARAAAAVSHPHIVTVYEIGYHRGVDLLVMEYLPGKTLEKSIPRRGFPVPKARDLAVQIAAGLQAAHSVGILHRDLKPSNVMLVEDGWAKLLDFGLAELSNMRRPHTGPAKIPPGTKRYMAPEQLSGKRGDVRSEIFSFGLLLHEMLSGAHPFKRPTQAQTIKAIQTKEPAALPPKVSASFRSLIERCLAKEPARRFDSMQDVLTDLQEFQHGFGGESPRPAQNPKPTALEVRRVHVITKRISYQSVAQSRRAIDELSRLLQCDPSTAVRETAVAYLKKLILTLPDYGGNGVSDPVREVRVLVMGAMKVAAQGRLGACFDPRDLETLDLYAMDFSHENMASLSFRRCFIIESSFRGSDLTSASFPRAFIRNVDFTAANLSNVDFTDADWFNALGLTESQLVSTQRQTIRECPANVARMHEVLQARYGHGFNSWSSQVQKQLLAAWSDYLRPGGLRDTVAEWRRNPR